MRHVRDTTSAVLAALLLATCGAPTTAPPTSSTSSAARTGTTTTNWSPSLPTSSPAPTPTGTRSTAGPDITEPGRTATITPTPVPSAQRLRVGGSAWVAVSVATLWRSPSSPRPVDGPALRSPAQVRTWLAAMSDTQRRGLNGRADTQALLGDRVVVTSLSGSWAKVVVPDQPTPSDRRGYPGWVPRVQLTAVPVPTATTDATVVSRTTWLRTDDSASSRVIEVSFGTRLPKVSQTGGWVRVRVPSKGILRVAAPDVSVTLRGAAALPTRGAAMLTSAMRFKGLPYLWAGASGFGVDCSGFVWLVHRVHGITIPRDARPQSASGSRVDPTRLAPGDLLFYATEGLVHHVTMYAGDGVMIHAPRTGATVETVRVSTPSYAAELWGTRRYLP